MSDPTLATATTPAEYRMAAWLAVPPLRRLEQRLLVRGARLETMRAGDTALETVRAARYDVADLIADLGSER